MVEVAKQHATTIAEPMDLVLLSLKDKVYVKCRNGRELRGKLVVRWYTSHIPILGLR